MPPDIQALSPYAYQKAFSLPLAWERIREAQSARVMRLGARDKVALTTILPEDVAAAAYGGEVS